MPSINWNKLDSPNPHVAWSIFAKEISDKFFQETLICVPSIDQASYYDLGTCFKISLPGWCRLPLNFTSCFPYWFPPQGCPPLRPTFRFLGHFLDIITAPAKDEIELMEVPFKEVLDFSEDLASTSYSYTWTDDKKDNSKSVTIKMSGMKKYKLNWNLKQGGRVVVGDKLHNKSVYVIKEVVYAEKVIIEVLVKKKKSIVEIRNPLGKFPVSFSYLEFPVDENGVLWCFAHEDTYIDLDAVFKM